MIYEKAFEAVSKILPTYNGNSDYRLICWNDSEELFSLSETIASYYCCYISKKFVGFYDRYEKAELVIKKLERNKVTRIVQKFKNGKSIEVWRIDEIPYSDKSQVIKLKDKFYSIEDLESILSKIEDLSKAL